jgi:hypothetical protein
VRIPSNRRRFSHRLEKSLAVPHFTRANKKLTNKHVIYFVKIKEKYFFIRSTILNGQWYCTKKKVFGFFFVLWTESETMWVVLSVRTRTFELAWNRRFIQKGGTTVPVKKKRDRVERDYWKSNGLGGVDHNSFIFFSLSLN